MVKSYACAGILLFAMGLFPLLAQDNAVAKEMAIKIADRIIASTVYEFKDVKTGKVYTSLDNVSLNPDMRVNSKYLNWHYTNGVTNMALMELGDKIQNRKYEDYVLKKYEVYFLTRLISLIFIVCMIKLSVKEDGGRFPVLLGI